MSKELKKELFNIYDVVVFEDGSGITQDCVCAIGKDKEIYGITNEIVDVIECNNHSISIYKNGIYRVWEKDGKDTPYYATDKKIIYLYTLKNDNRFYEIYPTSDYEPIDNADPGKALNGLEYICKVLNEKHIDVKWLFKRDYNVIKQVLQKTQEMGKENAEYKEVLKIVFEKRVDLCILTDCDNVNEYNKSLGNFRPVEDRLTYEEFDLVKRYFKNVE